MEYYRASDHAAWLIESLIVQPDVRVSFFSGGERERNRHLLRSIRLSDGRTALDIATHTFHREDLTPVSSNSALPFHEVFKKRLRGLIRDFDPTRTILVDGASAPTTVTSVYVLDLETFRWRRIARTGGPLEEG